MARAPPPAAFDLDYRHHAGEGARATQKLPSSARPGRVGDPSPHDLFPQEHLRPKCPVQRPVLNGFGDMFGLDGGGTLQVGYGAGYL